MGTKLEVQLEIERRAISAPGPAEFHTQQPKERYFTYQKCGEEIPSILLFNPFKGLERNEKPPSLERKNWDGAVRCLFYRH